jgi:hypothetical protein
MEQRECDDGFSRLACFGDQCSLELVRDRHFACGDLGLRGFDEAEFATAEGFTLVHADRWPEDAAGHGTPCIDVAEAGFGIECGTRGIVGEVFEAGLLFIGIAEQTGCEIARKIVAVLCKPCAGTLFDGFGDGGVGQAEVIHPSAEAEGVECVDGKGSMAALGAAGAAGKPTAGATSGIGKSRIDDLYELPVAAGELHKKRIVC